MNTTLRPIHQVLPHQATALQSHSKTGVRRIPQVQTPQYCEPPAQNHAWDPEPNQHPPLPHPSQWVRSMTRLIFEVLLERRTVDTLQHWVDTNTLRTFAGIRKNWNQQELTQAKGLIRIGITRICPLRQGVVECSTNVSLAGHTHAVAIRLEAQRRRWIVTAFETY